MATAVRELDEELTSQKIEVTLHGAAIKQLLEERRLERDHGWQIKALVVTVLATDIAQLLANLISTHGH